MGVPGYILPTVPKKFCTPESWSDNSNSPVVLVLVFSDCLLSFNQCQKIITLKFSWCIMKLDLIETVLLDLYCSSRREWWGGGGNLSLPFSLIGTQDQWATCYSGLAWESSFLMWYPMTRQQGWPWEEWKSALSPSCFFFFFLASRGGMPNTVGVGVIISSCIITILVRSALRAQGWGFIPWVPTWLAVFNTS